MIYKQGTIAKSIYIVTTGDFEIVRRNKLMKKEERKDTSLANIKNYLGPLKAQEHDITNNFPLNMRSKSHYMKVSVLGKNQMFGHEDVLNNRNYTTTVKCISNHASIYCCKAEEFFNIINRDERSRKILYNQCLYKNSTLITNI